MDSVNLRPREYNLEKPKRKIAPYWGPRNNLGIIIFTGFYLTCLVNMGQVLQLNFKRPPDVPIELKFGILVLLP